MTSRLPQIINIGSNVNYYSTIDPERSLPIVPKRNMEILAPIVQREPNITLINLETARLVQPFFTPSFKLRRNTLLKPITEQL